MFITILLCLLSVYILYKNWDRLKSKLLGLISLDGFNLSFKKFHLIIQLYNVKLNKDHVSLTSNQPVFIFNSNYLLNPLFYLFTIILNHISIHIDSLSIQLNQSNSLYFDSIKLNSSLNIKQQRQLIVNLQLGDISLKQNENPIIQLTNTTLISIGCHRKLTDLISNRLDLIVQSENIYINLNHLSLSSQSTNTLQIPSLKIISNIINILDINLKSFQLDHTLNDIPLHISALDLSIIYPSSHNHQSKVHHILISLDSDHSLSIPTLYLTHTFQLILHQPHISSSSYPSIQIQHATFQINQTQLTGHLQQIRSTDPTQSIQLELNQLELSLERVSQSGSSQTWLSRFGITGISLDMTDGVVVWEGQDEVHEGWVPEGHLDNTPPVPVKVQIRLELERIVWVRSESGWKAEGQGLGLMQGVYQMMFLSHLTARDERGDLTIKIKKVGLNYSIRHHYGCLLGLRGWGGSGGSGLAVSVGRLDVRLELPFDQRLYLRLDQLDFRRVVQKQAIQIRNLMVLGVSPVDQDKWSQLLELDQVSIGLDLDPIVFANSRIVLDSKKILVTIPHNFILADVINSIIGLSKAVKELQSRILNQDAFTYFGPTAKDQPVLLPYIKIKSGSVLIQIDDDPFEAKLRNILRTGLIEQQRRATYERAFESKTQDILNSEPPSSPSSTLSSTIQAQIDEAQQNLYHYFSKFWIKYINKSNKAESDFYRDLYHQTHYRNPISSDLIDRQLDHDGSHSDRPHHAKIFNINIVPRPLSPPLAGLSIDQVKIRLERSALDDTRLFLNQAGGVPFDREFAILIPFRLVVKAAGETSIKIRDYPLPLLHVPPPTEGQVSWKLEGNYVAADELGNVGGSRVVPITIIPPDPPSTPGYRLLAVRTTSPLKFYSVVDCQVYTKGMSMICWSVSDKSGIQDILRVLGRLTPAQVDPSPGIGFWDKVRFMIHSKIKISFVGGGDLALVVKGSRDPYELNGRGAGLAKVWSQNVVWLLGHENEQKEFMQIISDDYAFGVPDLVRGGFVPDALDRQAYTLEQTSYHRRHRFLKTALYLTHGIRMGIGLSFERLSCNPDYALDTTLCSQCKSRHPIDRCRTQKFLPHYKVVYQSKEQVEKFYDKDTYDAFKGFRSDFIHLSFSIVKLNDEPLDYIKDDPYADLLDKVSQNSMHLTPCFIEHFLDWYGLFGSPVSLPIRRGNLFSVDEPKTKSFGELLDTIKYKIVVNPLAISMIYTDLDTYLNIKGGGTVGLKARVSTFGLDLHQRRELTPSFQNQSSTDSVPKTSIYTHEAEIGLTDIDLRVVKAVYDRISVEKDRPSSTKSTKTSKSQTKSISESAVSDNEAVSITSSIFSDEDENSNFQWNNVKDFVFLDSVTRHQPLYSKIENFPFIYSPLFRFVRQTTHVDTGKRDYLRHTHECIFGKGLESHAFQKSHLERRAYELDKVIEDHDNQLDIIIHAMETYKHGKNNLREEHKRLEEKLNNLRIKRYMLHEYLAQLILETELNSTGDRDTPNSNSSSVCRRDEISRWEMLMGHFKDRVFIHYPQIIWNSSVRDTLFYLKEIKSSRSMQSFNLSARCLRFLEELAHAANEKRKSPNLDFSNPNSAQNDTLHDLNNPHENDQSMTETLIQKLLSERKTSFVVYNETQEGKNRKGTGSVSSDTGDQEYDGDRFFEGSSKNFDNPDYQHQSISSQYKMNSSYLVDLIHPQMVFQSNKCANHLVLVTNERIQLKGLEIMDDSDSSTFKDHDMKLVKKRSVASFDNAQLLIVRKTDEIQSYSSLVNNYYGQYQENHWAAWIQPEQLWHYRDAMTFENFQRVATHLTGSIQIDTFNHLRISVYKDEIAQKNPFENRTNTFQLHLPHFEISLDSLQTHILNYTLTDLALDSGENPKMKRRLEKLRDVMLAAERSDLSETVKQVNILQNQSRYLLQYYRQFKGQYRFLDEEGKKEFRRNKKTLRRNLDKLYFVIEAIRCIQVFRRDINLEQNEDTMRMVFSSEEMIWEAILDRQKNKSLCKCILTNIIYVLLKKPNGSSKNSIEIGRLQIKNTTESPIFKDVLDAYVDPNNPIQLEGPRFKMISGVLDYLPPVGGIPIIQHLEINTLPLNLQLSSAFIELTQNYLFPEANLKNKDDISIKLNTDDSERDLEMIDKDASSEEYDDSDVSSIQELRATDNIHNNNTGTPSSKREGSFMGLDTLKSRVRKSIYRKNKTSSDELTVMKARSSSNRTFIYIRIPSTKHCISIRGPSSASAINIYNFSFKQPKLEYRNVTWSNVEMMETIKKEFKIALFKQSPALLKKKLLDNNRQSTPNISSTSNDFVMSKISNTSTLNTRRIETEPDSSNTKRQIRHTASNEWTTEEDIGEESYEEDTKSLYSNEDTKSLHSNVSEDEINRLIELQLTDNSESFNVDNELSNMYMKKYKRKEMYRNELIEKGKALLGAKYTGPIFGTQNK